MKLVTENFKAAFGIKDTLKNCPQVLDHTFQADVCMLLLLDLNWDLAIQKSKDFQFSTLLKYSAFQIISKCKVDML